MAILSTATTSVSTISIDTAGIVDWVYNPGALVTLTEAREEIGIAEDLVARHGGQARLLIDIRQIQSVSGPARKLFSSDATSDLGAVGLALLVDSVFSKVIGNFYMTVNRPKHITRLFTDKALAISWLASLPGRST